MYMRRDKHLIWSANNIRYILLLDKKNIAFSDNDKNL
jgi:hypothetical protein